MKNINLEQIKRKIGELPIEKIAIESGFQKRGPKKIDPVSFVGGFFKMLCEGRNSLESWAQGICSFVGKLVSKQGVQFRLQFRQEGFAKRLLEESLRAFALKGASVPPPKLFGSFAGVYIEDSSCVKFPANLAEFFPGPFSHKGDCAVARVQLRLNLLNESCDGLHLGSYRDNDQGFAGDILSVLKAGWLCIRDMGYWSIAAFRGMASKGAFFLSRLKPGVLVVHPEGGEVMELLPLLEKCRRRGKKVLDMDVLLGKEERLPVRLVAVEVPQGVCQSRRRKALKDRNKKANHSEEYLGLLGWSLFVTNVGRGAWNWKDILNAYGFRWRIEVVFKCWKGKFGLQALFDKKESISPARAVITICLFLLWLTVFFVRWFGYFLQAVHHRKGKFVSLLKFADFVKERFCELLQTDDLEQFIETVAYYYTYGKRRNRYNYMEMLYALNLT